MCNKISPQLVSHKHLKDEVECQLAKLLLHFAMANMLLKVALNPTDFTHEAKFAHHKCNSACENMCMSSVAGEGAF